MSPRPPTEPAIAARRLAAQRISVHDFDSAAVLVRALGAVQAQDLAGAKWAVALRLGDVTEGTIEKALAAGMILRTHAMRMTWQFVHPADVRPLVALFAPRLFRKARRRHADLGLGTATFRRSRRVLERALAGGAHRTREELAAALGGAGISTSEQRLSHLLAAAELEGLLVSGAPQGRKQTFALLDDRVPTPRRAPGLTDTIAGLALRYFRTRGPATLGDFAWWSGLTLAETRPALEALGSRLVSEEHGGRTLWSAADASRVAPAPPAAVLLPPFDEFLVAYRNRADALATVDASRVNAGGGLLNPCVLLRGRVAGTWRREIGRRGMAIEIRPFRALTGSEERVIRAAGTRYARFLGAACEVDFRQS